MYFAAFSPIALLIKRLTCTNDQAECLACLPTKQKMFIDRGHWFAISVGCQLQNAVWFVSNQRFCASGDHHSNYLLPNCIEDQYDQQMCQRYFCGVVRNFTRVFIPNYFRKRRASKIIISVSFTYADKKIKQYVMPQQIASFFERRHSSARTLKQRIDCNFVCDDCSLWLVIRRSKLLCLILGFSINQHHFPILIKAIINESVRKERNIF